MKNVLTLVARGCDYAGSDAKSYRLTTTDYNLKGKDGRTYFIEVSHWDKHKMRYTNKRTGAQLKHPVWERVNANALHIDTAYYEKREGNDYEGCYRNLNLENDIHNMNLDYTLNGILKAINTISATQYDAIEIV